MAFKHVATRTLYGDLQVTVSRDSASHRFIATHEGVLNGHPYSVTKFADGKAEIFKRVDEMAEEVKAFHKRHEIKSWEQTK